MVGENEKYIIGVSLTMLTQVVIPLVKLIFGLGKEEKKRLLRDGGEVRIKPVPLTKPRDFKKNKRFEVVLPINGSKQKETVV